MLRVLVVDDESAVLRLMSTAFRRAGYEVETASSGKDAIQLCEKGSFDAVLSDVGMPEMDGHQMVSRIRKLTPNIAAVLMSGLHMECTGECAVPVRHCRWMQKPLLPDEAVAAVAQSIAEPRVGPMAPIHSIRMTPDN